MADLSELRDALDHPDGIPSAYPGAVLPYLPLWVDDLMASPDVRGMSMEEFGCYLMLLLTAWQQSTPGFLPHDTALLARWIGVGGPMNIPPIVLKKFKVTRDGHHFYNRRLIQCYVEAREGYDQRRAAGQKGAAARRKHSNKDTDGNPPAYPDGNPSVDRAGEQPKPKTNKTTRRERAGDDQHLRTQLEPGFQTFLRTHPGASQGPEAARREFAETVARMALDAGGIDQVVVLLTERAAWYARECKDKGTELRYIKTPENWLKDHGYEAAKKPSSTSTVNAREWVEAERQKLMRRGIDTNQEVFAQKLLAAAGPAVKGVWVGGIGRDGTLVLLAPDAEAVRCAELFGNAWYVAAEVAGQVIQGWKLISAEDAA